MKLSKKLILFILLILYFSIIVNIVKVLIAEIYFLRAKDIENTKYWIRAVSFYEKALSFDPKRLELYERLSRLYFLKALFPINDESQILKMEKTLLKGISLCPYSGDLHLGIGLFYEAIGKDKEAEDYYKKAIFLDPNNAFYHTILSAFYLKRGRNSEGIMEAKKAVACSNASLVLKCLKKLGVNINKKALIKDGPQ